MVLVVSVPPHSPLGGSSSSFDSTSSSIVYVLLSDVWLYVCLVVFAAGELAAWPAVALIGGRVLTATGISHRVLEMNPDQVRAAQAAGFIPKDRAVDLITGLVLDRLGNQIMFAATSADNSTTVLNDDAYAEAWLAANIDVMVHGLAGPTPDSS